MHHRYGAIRECDVRLQSTNQRADDNAAQKQQAQPAGIRFQPMSQVLRLTEMGMPGPSRLWVEPFPLPRERGIPASASWRRSHGARLRVRRPHRIDADQPCTRPSVGGVPRTSVYACDGNPVMNQDDRLTSEGPVGSIPTLLKTRQEPPCATDPGHCTQPPLAATVGWQLRC